MTIPMDTREISKMALAAAGGAISVYFLMRRQLSETNAPRHPSQDPHPDQPSFLERLQKVAPAASLGGLPAGVIVARASGGRAWDVEGKAYVDFLLGSGACFLGHAHPAVVTAVSEQAALGSTFMVPNRTGIELAEAICEAVPCAEQVRFCSEGSAACQMAIRLARAFTGKQKVLKFEGGYHGTGDVALMSMAPAGPSKFPHPDPDSAGLEPGTAESVLVAPYNDVAHVCRLIADHAQDLACVIVEPFQRVIPPLPGFLQALRAETSASGIVLVFDEVVTGFRWAYGGAQELYGVIPDLCTLGKALAGGYPLAAVAGRRDIMQHFDATIVGHDRAVFAVNTLNGNAVAAAASLATLRVLREPGTFERVHATGKQLMDALSSSLAAVGIPAEIVGHPLMFDVQFSTPTNRGIVNYRDTQRGDAKTKARFNELMHEHGVLKYPGKFYVSVAHTDEDIKLAQAAFAAAAETLKAEGFAPS